MPKGKRGGRVAGQRNKRTVAMMQLAAEGETPVAHALRVMRDETQSPDLRLQAARIAAPYLHPRPNPERFAKVDLPEALDRPSDILVMHASLLNTVAAGALSLEAGQQLSAIITAHLRLAEFVDLEARIATLERKHSK